ncbi:ribosome silencing factor [Deferribacterales bacterium RsTz2092]
MNASLDLAKRLKLYIDDKLGENIVCLDVREQSSITDFLIIATGKADTHVRAVSESMLEDMKKQGIAPLASEGVASGTWSCVDYGDVIVHIMRKNERDFYALEAIWGAAKRI